MALFFTLVLQSKISLKEPFTLTHVLTFSHMPFYIFTILEDAPCFINLNNILFL
jgi:hypothetical protein